MRSEFNHQLLEDTSWVLNWVLYIIRNCRVQVSGMARSRSSKTDYLLVSFFSSLCFPMLTSCSDRILPASVMTGAMVPS